MFGRWTELYRNYFQKLNEAFKTSFSPLVVPLELKRRSPKIVAGAAYYYLAKSAKVPEVTQHTVAQVLNATEVSIRYAYHDLLKFLKPEKR